MPAHGSWRGVHGIHAGIKCGCSAVLMQGTQRGRDTKEYNEAVIHGGHVSRAAATHLKVLGKPGGMWVHRRVRRRKGEQCLCWLLLLLLLVVVVVVVLVLVVVLLLLLLLLLLLQGLRLLEPPATRCCC